MCPLLTLGEEFGINELALSAFGRESGTEYAHAFPAMGNGTKFQIREVVPFRPDTSVLDTNNDVKNIVGFGPEVEELQVTAGRPKLQRMAVAREDHKTMIIFYRD